MSDTETQIDVVYLWVNSNDKKWQNKRRNSFDIFLKNDKDNIALYANTDGRFRDNGELIFNLRCLENFFPKHGHVYIVTDEQRPEWLVQNKNVTSPFYSSLYLNVAHSL